MVIPSVFDEGISEVHYFQGVLIAEVAVTLAVYIVLKIIHYVNGVLQRNRKRALLKVLKRMYRLSKIPRRENGNKKSGMYTSPSFIRIIWQD